MSLKYCAWHEKVRPGHRNLHLSRKIIEARMTIWCSDLREMHLCRSSSNVPPPQNPHVLLTFCSVQNPLGLPAKTTLEHRKVALTCGVLAFSLRNVRCATTACAFSTSELPKVLRTWNALPILTWKCASHHSAAALFPHLSIQKCSGAEVFWAFGCIWTILASKRASPHNPVHFFDVWTSKSAPNP